MTVHLHWNYAVPGDLGTSTRVAVAVCGQSFIRELMTSDPAKATCDTCVDRHKEREERLMTEAKTINIHDLSGPQLAFVYNALRPDKPAIKKFRDLETGRRQLTVVMSSSQPSRVAELLHQAMAQATDVADTQEAKAPLKVTEQRVEKTTKGKVASRSKNSSGISPDSEIHILDEAYGNGGRETQTIKRWKKFVETKTVGEYCTKVGQARGMEDVKWWIKHKRISVK